MAKFTELLTRINKTLVAQILYASNWQDIEVVNSSG